MANKETDKEAIKEANKEANKEDRLKRQIKIICELIRENPHATYNEFMEKLGIRYSSVYERIKMLKQQGVISREGGLYGGKWRINESLLNSNNLN